MKKPITFLVILPTIVEEVADKCIESIDDAIKNNLLIIDNSPDGFAQKYNIRYEHHPENIGVARSWNIAVKEVMDRGLDYLIILSAAVVFEKGMVDFIEALNTELSPTGKQQYGVETQLSWHFIAIGRKTFERIGYFDENFYPAYYEDADFIRRMEVAGISDPMNDSYHLPTIQVAANRQGIALSIEHGLIVNFDALGHYFIEKWGKIDEWECQEQRDVMYNYPFNDQTKSLDYWEKHSINYLRDKYEL